jgi:hypothetical protein
MDIVVLDDNPIYNGDIYRLSFIFGTQYPIGKTHSGPDTPASCDLC